MTSAMNSPSAPLERGTVVSGVLSKRCKTKSGCPRYCLFTEDLEDLIIAAEETNKRCNYVISTDANNFSRNTPSYVGRTYTTEGSNFYKTIVPHQTEEKTFVDILKVGFKKYDSSHIWAPMLVTFGRAEEPGYFHERCDYGSVLQARLDNRNEWLRSAEIIESARNQVLTFAGDICFALARTHKDEYMFLAGYPLSVFHGFSIALAILSYVRK